MKNNSDEFVNEIIDLSKQAFDSDEIPVGAIVVKNNIIIGKGFNNREKSKCVLGHAEINAIVDACKNINDWRLDECDLYVSLRPCLMCIGTILESRIKNVYYLCEKTNNCLYENNEIKLIKINNRYMEDKYLNLLQSFFKNKRN